MTAVAVSHRAARAQSNGREEDTDRRVVVDVVDSTDDRLHAIVPREPPNSIRTALGLPLSQRGGLDNCRGASLPATRVLVPRNTLPMT